MNNTHREEGENIFVKSVLYDDEYEYPLFMSICVRDVCCICPGPLTQQQQGNELLLLELMFL